MAVKRCLVIGANGFIGSHLVDELAEAGCRVRAFDRYSRQVQFKTSVNIEEYKGDFFDPISIKKALVDVDYVFHSLSLTTPYSSDNDPFSDIDRNLRPTLKLLEACVEANIKKVIYISSGGAVYGSKSEEKSATEDDVPDPVSPYGINKLAVEHYLAYYNRKFNLEYIIYRLTNPYGSRQMFNNHQGVIPAFLDQIKTTGELHVFGDGTASRDYIYIRDATRMINESFSKHCKFRTYNIGSGKQTTINVIIQALKKVVNLDFSVVHEESPKTFLKSTSISMARFQSEFGSIQLTELDKGLSQTI